jgi:hypothetical protein
VTIMGTEGQRSASLNALKHSAGLMRTKLTKSLTLRVAPFIRFQLDHDLAKEMVVLDLLRKAAEETAESEKRRADQAEAASATPPPAVSDVEPPSGRTSSNEIPNAEATPNPEPQPNE